jgi:predicted PurR-regulated permease PerM
MTSLYRSRAVDIASYLLMTLALWTILTHGLLAALFAGLLVYSLVHQLAPLMARKFSSSRARVLVVAALATVTVALLSIAIWSLIAFFKSDAGSLQTLLQRLADIIEASRSQMPAWVVDHMPGDADSLRDAISSWLREHSVEAKVLGAEAGHTIVHIVIGMIIGAMVALHDTGEERAFLPLAQALRERVGKLSHCFRQIVFAQVRISAINAALTGIYLFIVLPLADVHLPLKKSLVLVTFLAGLLPVVGNLISNSMLVIVALSHSLQMALVSLLYMVVIHKLEYFLNARIIGAHINARAWELLTAMLVMEAVFGLPGVAAAPVFYAYVKQELAERGLV